MKKDDIFSKKSGYSRNSEYNSLANKIFSVLSVEKRPKDEFELSLYLEGIVKVGMPKDLIRVSWGEPDDINKSSYGEQWIYGEQYLYFKNGVMSAFN